MLYALKKRALSRSDLHDALWCHHAYQSLRLRTFHYQVQRHGAEHRLRLPMSAEVEGRSINLACTVS